jgi:hypothetical protein
MPYYHVLLSQETAPDNHRCVLRDLGKKDLAASFLKQYKSGKTLLCGSEIIPMQAVRRVTIISTDMPMDQALAKVSDEAEAHRRELNRGLFRISVLGRTGLRPRRYCDGWRRCDYRVHQGSAKPTRSRRSS